MNSKFLRVRVSARDNFNFIKCLILLVSLVIHLEITVTADISYQLSLYWLAKIGGASSPFLPNLPTSLLSSCSYGCPIASSLAAIVSPGNNCNIDRLPNPCAIKIDYIQVIIIAKYK